MEHGGYASQMPRDLKVHKRKVVDLGERIVLDKERCVLCSRCVRFCREVSGSHALQFFTRSVTTEIGTENNQPIEGDDYIGNVVDICPVGALTSKDFRFKQRVWFLKSAESVCNRCSTGCNIRVDHKDGIVYRYVPRRNETVNKSWMCDYGRDSYRDEQEDRILAPLVHDGTTLKDADWDEALDLVAARTQQAAKADPGSVAVIASPRQSNETNWLTRRYAREIVGTPHVDYRVDGSHVKTTLMQDALLRRQDPHPNNAGCAALEVTPGPGGAGVEAILDACFAGKVKVLHLMAPDVLTARHDQARVRDALLKVPFVVVHAHRNAPGLTDLAHVVLADASHLEQDGTFVNGQGRVQRFHAAFPPTGRARTAASVLAQLAARLGASLPDTSPLFDAMAQAEAAFSGLTWNGLGKHGQPLPSAQPQPVGS
jgi:NADH-quinone oxidoreductase subunit G